MEKVEEKINFLIEKKLGDSHRLNELLKRVKSGKQIYNSDTCYLERLSAAFTPETKKPLTEKLTNSKTPISGSEDIPILNKKPTTNRNIPDVRYSYAITYNTNYRDEIKIHANTCHHVQRASQSGPVKWTYAKSLKDAITLAGRLYPKYGSWKYPRCCLYHGDSYFECKNCNRYSEGNDNTQKLHSTRWRITGVFLAIIPFLVIFTNIQPRLTGLNILLIIIGLVLLAIENGLAPKVCRNCLSKNWGHGG